jgi:hypothetical protein
MWTTQKQKVFLKNERISHFSKNGVDRSKQGIIKLSTKGSETVDKLRGKSL